MLQQHVFFLSTTIKSNQVQPLIITSVSIVSLTSMFLVAKADPNNITESGAKPDIFSCIGLIITIIFVSVAGIAGGETISNIVERFIVSRRGPMLSGTVVASYRRGQGLA